MRRRKFITLIGGAAVQSIYNNPDLSEHVRMRAARDALPFERRKLMATALTIDGSFAEEKPIKRSQGDLKVIEGKVEQHDASELWPGAVSDE
jgi:hypothetical protein